MEENTNNLNQNELDEIKKDTCFIEYHKSTSSALSVEDSISQIDELNINCHKREQRELNSTLSYIYLN